MMSASRATALAFAAGLAAMWPSPSAAQVPRVSQTPATSRPMSGEPPTGTATRTTDKQGQTNTPRGITGTKQPPSGKLNLDHLPIERRGDGGTAAHQLTTSRDAASSGEANASASHHTRTRAKAAVRSSAKTAKSTAKKSAKRVRKAAKKHHRPQPQR